jgi:DNA repair protein RadD
MVNRTRKSLWNSILHLTQIKEIIDQGFWCKLKYESIDIDDSKLRMNRSRSEYSEESMDEVFKENDLDGQVLTKIEELRKVKKHILVFCHSVAKAKEWQSKCPNSAVVHATLPQKERDKNIEDFRTGKVQVMFNVFVLSVGFDFPGLDCIIDILFTASVRRYYQKIGRLCRLDPNDPNKEGLIVDYSGNVKRFGELHHIYFEESAEFGWAMFSKDVLLTNIDVTQIGTIRKYGLKGRERIPFGQKYYGMMIREVPLSYLNWLIKSHNWKQKDLPLKKAIEDLLWN